MTDRSAFADTQPLSWPRAAIGAVLFGGLMTVLLAVIPNQFVTPDPSQAEKIITIIYVVAVFAVVAWLIAAWQNRGQAPPPSESQRISAFGRPMREGPGFASFAKKLPSTPSSPAGPAGIVGPGSVENASSFGRPLKKRST